MRAAGKDEDGSASRVVGGSPRRRLSGILGLGVLMLLLGVMATLALSTLSLRADDARSEIEARLSELSGMDVAVDGDASFSLLPRAQLALTDIRIGSGDAGRDATLHIDAVVAELALWPALFGETRVKRLSILRPELLSTTRFIRRSTDEVQDTETTGEDGRTPRLRPPQELRPTSVSTRERYRQTSEFLGLFLSRFDDIDVIEVRDGVFRLDPAGGSFGISNANVTVSWPSETAAARLTGSYVWNGQPTDLDLRLASPLAFLSGETSDIDLTLASPSLTAAFDGSGATGGVGRFSGVLTVETPSLTGAIRWLADPRAVIPDIGPLSIEATLDGIGSTLALRNATVSLDGFTGEGSVEMAMAAGAKPTLGGTLAFQQLDLTGIASAVAPLPRTPFDLQRRFSVDFLDTLDLDLRLSAAAGAIGTVGFGDLAATIKFKDGVATFDVGDASVLGGRGQARLSIDSRASAPRALGFAAVSGVESPRLLAALGISAVGMSGRSDVTAEIEAPVTNWADLFQRNRMRVKVNARSGSLSGFDPQVFLSVGTRPFAFATQATAIPFRALRAELSTTGPRIELETMTLSGEEGAFEAAGVVSTTTNSIDLNGSFTPGPPQTAGTAAAPSLATSQPIAFTISGEWPRPEVTSGLPARPI